MVGPDTFWEAVFARFFKARTTGRGPTTPRTYLLILKNLSMVVTADEVCLKVSGW